MKDWKEALVGHVLGSGVVVEVAFSYVVCSLKTKPCQLAHTQHCSLSYSMTPSAVKDDNRSLNSQSKVKATLTLYEIAVKEHESRPIVYSTCGVGLSRLPVLMISFSGRNPKEILQVCDAEHYKGWAMALSSANKVHSSDWHPKKPRYKTQRT